MPMKLLMEMEMIMPINNSLRVRKESVNVDTYSPEMEDAFDADLYQEEDETEVPDRSSVIQVGWLQPRRLKTKPALLSQQILNSQKMYS